MWGSSECEQVRDSGNCMEQTVYNRAVGKLQIPLWGNLCWSWKPVLQNRTYVTNRKEEKNVYTDPCYHYQGSGLLPYILCLAHCRWLSVLGPTVKREPECPWLATVVRPSSAVVSFVLKAFSFSLLFIVFVVHSTSVFKVKFLAWWLQTGL